MRLIYIITIEARIDLTNCLVYKSEKWKYCSMTKYKKQSRQPNKQEMYFHYVYYECTSVKFCAMKAQIYT